VGLEKRKVLKDHTGGERSSRGALRPRRS